MILLGLSGGAAGGPPADGGKLALLTYPQSSFFGSIIWDQAMPRLTSRFRVETMCISAFSSALRAMVLAGLGMAWPPRSLADPDLASNVLTALAPEGLQHPLDIAIFARHPRGNDQDVALWRHPAQIDLATPMN